MSKTSRPVLIETIVGRKNQEPKTGHHAEILPGQWIRLFGETVKVSYKGVPGQWTRVEEVVPYSKTFKIGDLAEFDSFNLSYVARITSITEKTVTFEDDCQGVKRLSIYEFDWRNYDFDLEATRERNAQESQCI